MILAGLRWWIPAMPSMMILTNEQFDFSLAIIWVLLIWSWMIVGEVISYEEYHPFGTTAYQAVSQGY